MARPLRIEYDGALYHVTARGNERKPIFIDAVRAGMVKSPDDWRWSSYRATAGAEAPHGCLTTDWIIGLFAKRRETARCKYSEFVIAGTGEESIWPHVQGQVVLGDEEFRERFLDYLKGREDVQEIPKSQRLMGRPSLAQLWKGSKGGGKQSRDERIREAVQKYGYRLSEVAEHVKLHYSTVSRIANTKTVKRKT